MDRCFPLISAEAFCVWKAVIMFPWWLRNDLHLLFINIVGFQGYRFSENTISGTLVAAFSLRSPPGFSQTVLRTIEGSHGWDNDSRWSFHERTHHMDRLHSNVNILPWMEPFDKARFISAEIYWHGPLFSLADTLPSLSCHHSSSELLWGGRRCSDGVLRFGSSNVEFESDLETFSQQSINIISIDFACHCLWCYGWLVDGTGRGPKWSSIMMKNIL